MNNTKTIALAALITIGSTASIFAQGCCGAMDATAATNSAANPTLTAPVQSLLDNYLKAESNLAKDSVEGLQQAAKNMAKAIEGTQGLPAKITQQVQALADAKDIEAAREALKPLSKSMIDYLKAQKALTGKYKEAYCPMAKASWIQTGAELANPYMGKAMLRCGQFKS